METKTVISRITDYGRKPTTVAQALTQARALLGEERKWCKQNLFKDGPAKKSFENGSVCGSWQVCSLGAIGVVTGDMPIQVSKEEQTLFDGLITVDYWWEEDNMTNATEDTGTLTHKAAEVLALAVLDLYGVDSDDYFGHEERVFIDEGTEHRHDEPTAVVVAFNDSRTNRKQVLKAFDHAIELARNPKRLTALKATIQGEE